MRADLIALTMVVGSAAAATVSRAETVATFADPTIDGSTPMFTYTYGTNVLTGGWSGTNLTLQVPVEAPSGASYPNAHFTMTPLTTVGAFGPALVMSAGQVNFFDASSNPLLTICFSGGLLQPTTNFGSSDFIGFDVAFSGPAFAGSFPPINEAFAFSFANLVNHDGGYSVTASFTSSADAAPAPGGTVLLALGGLLAARRRR